MAKLFRQEDKNASFALFSTSECIAWLTLFGMESAAIVMLNALIIIVYLKVRSLRKRSMYLVINQVVADMFVGGCVITRFCFLGKRCKFWTINFLNFPSAIAFHVWYRCILLATVANLAAICLERMHATFRPFKHRLIKGKMFGAAVAAVWITSGLCSAIAVLDVIHSVTIGDLNRGFFTLYLSFFLFFLLIPLFSYTSIAIKIFRGNQHQYRGATSRERKLTKTLFIMTVAFLLLTLPFILFRISFAVALRALRIVSNGTFFRLHHSLSLLCFANSLVNPVLYTLRIPEFKRALFSSLRCRSHPQLSQVFPLYEKYGLLC